MKIIQQITLCVNINRYSLEKRELTQLEINMHIFKTDNLYVFSQCISKRHTI